MKRPTAALLVALVASVGGAAAQQAPSPPSPRRLAPVDESARDASWVAFRDQLLRAIRSHDRMYLIGVLQPGITHSFGGASGPAAFRQHWKLDDNPSGSAVWKILESALTLGGTFTGKTTFCAPYVYTKFPKDLDPVDHGVVLRSNAPVFSRPASDSPLAASISFEILKMDKPPASERSPETAWVLVHLANGRPGYMRLSDIRSPIDYRACFVKRSGAWKMSVLAAGD